MKKRNFFLLIIMIIILSIKIDIYASGHCNPKSAVPSSVCNGKNKSECNAASACYWVEDTPSPTAAPTPTPTPTPTPCPAGTYGTPGNCTNCPAGTYSSSAGSSQCTECEGNTYSAEGASACTECTTGKVSGENGMKTTCNKCEVTQISILASAKNLTEGTDYSINIYTNNKCRYSDIAFSTTNANTTVKNFNRGSIYIHFTPLKPCEYASITASSNGESISKQYKVYKKEWVEVCGPCASEKRLFSQSYAEDVGESKAGYNCTQEDDGKWVCDKIYSKFCDGGFSPRYNYCCVDNELPGLSKNVFQALRKPEKPKTGDEIKGNAELIYNNNICNKYAPKYGMPTFKFTNVDSPYYTLITDEKIIKEKCSAPPPIPGKCEQDNILKNNTTPKEAGVCETEVVVNTTDGVHCTNKDANAKSFYQISCTRTISNKFDYGDDNSDVTVRSISKGNGIKYGIYVNTVVKCDYYFYENIWKEVYNKFIQKISLIDDNLIPYVQNDNHKGWDSYIASHFNKLRNKDNISRLYEFWNTVDELKEVVEQYNEYQPSDNYVENVSLRITTNDNENKTLKTDDFLKEVLDEGKFSKSNVVSKTLNIRGLTNPKDYTLTNSGKPRKVKFIPKKTCVNNNTGDVIIIGANEECKDSNIAGGNKVYIDYDTEPETYKFQVTVNGLGVNSKPENAAVINEKCLFNVLDEEVNYRPIEISNPFINSKWEKGHNWVNEMYDFTKTIHKDTWTKKSQKTIDISKEDISKLQASTAKLIRDKYSPYMGICDLINKNSQDSITKKLCAAVE